MVQNKCWLCNFKSYFVDKFERLSLFIVINITVIFLPRQLHVSTIIKPSENGTLKCLNGTLVDLNIRQSLHNLWNELFFYLKFDVTQTHCHTVCFSTKQEYTCIYKKFQSFDLCMETLRCQLRCHQQRVWMESIHVLQIFYLITDIECDEYAFLIAYQMWMAYLNDNSNKNVPSLT